MSFPCPFHPLTICFPLFLHPSFLDPAVFPSGWCSSALDLSCWKCQKCAFSPCRVSAVSLISSMHFLFACWNRVGLGLLLGGCCVFAEETFVSQNSIAAPCHCPKSIDWLCLVLHPRLHSLILFFQCFLPLFRVSFFNKNKLKTLHLSLPKKHAMASYYLVDFIPPLCTQNCSTLGGGSEAGEPALPQGGKVDSWVWKWLWLILIHCLRKPGVTEVLFSYPPLAQQDHSAPGDFQAAEQWFRRVWIS